MQAREKAVSFLLSLGHPNQALCRILLAHSCSLKRDVPKTFRNRRLLTDSPATAENPASECSEKTVLGTRRPRWRR
jgi:hypothetical protein